MNTSRDGFAKSNATHYSCCDHFVIDGRDRLRAARQAEVRGQVESEYADRFESAGFWQTIWLRVEVIREVNRRLDQVEPSREALF